MLHPITKGFSTKLPSVTVTKANPTYQANALVCARVVCTLRPRTTLAVLMPGEVRCHSDWQRWYFRTDFTSRFLFDFVNVYVKDSVLQL